MKTDLDHQFEFQEDRDWGKWFWKGFAYAMLFSAMIALGLIRLGAFIAERLYE